MSVPRVVVDACLLVKGNVSNIIFDLANSGLIQLHWTAEIGDEFFRNWSRRQAEKQFDISSSQYAECLAEKEIKARQRLEKFELMQVEWRIPGWNLGVAEARMASHLAMAEKSASAAAGISLKVDTKDRHVALAGIMLARLFPEDEVWIATENLDDIPPEVLKKFRVEVFHQKTLIETLHSANSTGVISAVEKTRADSKRPPFTQQEMLRILAHPDHMGSSAMSQRLKDYWKR